jgi:hypothetical protein
MQDKTIDGALLALRKQIIREKREGLAHVEALLALRGVHMPAVLPAKRKDVAGKGVSLRLFWNRYRTGRFLYKALLSMCRLGVLNWTLSSLMAGLCGCWAR